MLKALAKILTLLSQCQHMICQLPRPFYIEHVDYY
ncbi:hypothetical protein BVRB_1g020910 [Beta vulgaris subsp. vulgaris]|nr:hypothetical protein BVRB_1g020910 [Beta vulgaris subsp. vulgaris]